MLKFHFYPLEQFNGYFGYHWYPFNLTVAFGLN